MRCRVVAVMQYPKRRKNIAKSNFALSHHSPAALLSCAAALWLSFPPFNPQLFG